jgi:hypothetical protein
MTWKLHFQMQGAAMCLSHGELPSERLIVRRRSLNYHLNAIYRVASFLQWLIDRSLVTRA